MEGDLNGRAFVEAVLHPVNYKPILFCSISLIAAGILMAIFGSIFLIIDNIEYGPPKYDELYERYEGSSLAQSLGPLLIVFGGLVIVGNIMLLTYATRSYFSHQNRTNGRQTEARSALP